MELTSRNWLIIRMFGPEIGVWKWLTSSHFSVTNFRNSSSERRIIIRKLDPEIGVWNWFTSSHFSVTNFRTKHPGNLNSHETVCSWNWCLFYIASYLLILIVATVAHWIRRLTLVWKSRVRVPVPAPTKRSLLALLCKTNHTFHSNLCFTGHEAKIPISYFFYIKSIK